MKKFFNIFNGNQTKNTLSSEKEETTDLDKIKQYKNEIKDIKIENQPFRLSGLLHILTNKVANQLKKQRHKLYYDIENEVGRYIIGDNDYIEQVLEILVKDAILLNNDAEIVLKISKYKDQFLLFDVRNEKGLIKKNIYRQYVDVKQIISNQSVNVNVFTKAKAIAEMMHGAIEVKSNKASGTHYIFKIPYYKDKNKQTHQEELKKILVGKKSLFIGKDKYDTQRAQYIFETYGICIENMKLNDFENKKPNLSKYNMAIIRSADLSYKHISFFKTIYKDKRSDFKIIIVHELFEDEEKINFSKSIAHGELYSPTVIGDVEEILYQIFILKSKAVKRVSNIEIFDRKTFIVKGNNHFDDNYLEYYKGAHIAIVEDSKVDEKILKNILKQDGITLFSVSNGVEMIALLEDEEIDIIFTDINMPIMDGILMTKEIRLMEKWKKIPIISISSMVFPNELKKMKEAGINAAITKPIETNDVYMALEKFLIMTDVIRMRQKEEKNIIKFSFNKEVLDVEKGIKNAKSDLDYLKNLLMKMEYVRSRRDSFENMIYNQEYIALGEYVRNTLVIYKNIYAPAMIKMFEELTFFMVQKQRAYLIDYVSLYKKNWEALEEEVENCIANI